MKTTKKILASLFLFAGIHASAQRQMETLDRGVVAVRNSEGKAFVSWRLLGTESTDLTFNLYRTVNGKTEKLNKEPISKTTNFLDNSVDTVTTASYVVKPISSGKEGASSKPFVLKAGNAPYFSIALQTPKGYAPNDASVGDLDGDGQYEIILHQTGRGHDNSQAGFTDPPIIQAYKLDGTLLWTINLGKNIREGAHYTQFMVFDLDGDGRAEVAMKTADGSIDGKGNVIGDSTKDWRNDKGYILSGPEYLTVFDGLTGKALYTTDFVPPRHAKLNPTPDELKAEWGDGYGNRMDRFLAAIAYLDGKTPSLIMSRGYYTRTFITAWNFKNGKLQRQWTFDSDDPAHPENKPFRGQGNHNLTVADVDGDGKDEIVYGAMCIDDNGKGLYSTGFGHGDAQHVTDLDPSRPGLEVFGIQERFDDAGSHMFDARTGEVLWKKASVKAGADGEGPGRGLALDIDPRYPGYECWSFGAGITGLYDCKGNLINAQSPPSCNMGIFWDGDVLAELLDGTNIMKWDYVNNKTSRLLSAGDYNCVKNNGTKSNPVLSADIWGDWREEVIYRTADNNELRIFTTSIPTDKKFYTLMHDPQYRLSIAWQNVAYNQPPHTSFYFGEGMSNPPKPNIALVQTKKKVETALK
ncbi:rhamnogalacturonan lyase [Flavisolibacter ginsenosidimutans]|uniref:Rhamnogalacturonan lyase n=1 Tax=Flavisolibacter ginsenosidimutans TaxID=661481 RepID=A0A5B8UFJ2_9BACT|nr:rhamnogalacturonan lyase [Flavisolibacter ginsenosidimutans]QEC55243.1 rhamnogalacturonan lyase [Flavisolibacter ginsenosidimutans]